MLERQPSPPADRNAGVLGDGWGIDHVAIVVRNLEAAEELYRSQLGFTVSPGGSFPHFGSVRNSIIGFGQSYLEVITVDPATAIGLGEALAGFLSQTEGALMLGLHVSSTQHTADFLRERGFEIAGPVGGTITLDGEAETPPERWRYVGFAQPILPADPVFFLEYDSTEGIALPVPPAQHANTAQRLATVWMAVSDLDAAAAAYELIGLPAGREIRHEHLGAVGREVPAGSGAIWLLEATDVQGAVASFLARRGEGVIGIGIEVGSLDRATTSLAGNIQQQITPYAGIYGRSILLNPELACGTWIELFQPNQT